MATFASLPPYPPAFDGLTAKSSTLVQFAVGACMDFVQHLVQRLMGFGRLETERALMIGNLVPALELLLISFGGMRLGIGSTPPVFLLDSSPPRDMPVVDLLVSPGFDLSWKATGLYSRIHSDSDLRQETVMTMFFVSGSLLLAMLAGAWFILARASITEVTTDAQASIYGSSSEQGFKPGLGNADATSKYDTRTRPGEDLAGHRRPEPHGDERKDNRTNDSDDDDDDDDDDDPSPPPPGPGTGVNHDNDRSGGENDGWKNLGVLFVLGCLVAVILKVLRKLKTKARVQKRDTDLEVDGMDYGKEWHVLDGTYGFSRSKSSDIASWLKPDFRLTVGAVPFAEAIPSAMSYAVARNQTISDFSTRNPRQRHIWAGMTKIKATLEKAKAQFDLQSMVAIQICLESLLETFGLVDFGVLVVLPLIISVLRYRYDEQDNSGVVVDGGTQEPDYEPLSEANEAQWCPIRREDDENFVYLDQRVSAPSNGSANGNNPEHIKISTPCSSPRRNIERYAAHYSELAEFIVRHDTCHSEEAELAHDTSLIKDYADDTVTALTPVGNGEESHVTDIDHDSERSSWEDFDQNREFEGARELLDDLSDVESYITAEETEFRRVRVGDETNAQEVEMESLYKFCSDKESVRYIDDGYAEDEVDDSIRLFPGSFPVPFQPQMLGQVPIWGTRTNRWSIFAQLDKLREGEPLLASEAIDFGLPRSNLSAAVDLLRTPQASTKTLLCTPPAVPRGRKMRLKEKLLKEIEGNEVEEIQAGFFPDLD